MTVTKQRCDKQREVLPQSCESSSSPARSSIGRIDPRQIGILCRRVDSQEGQLRGSIPQECLCCRHRVDCRQRNKSRMLGEEVSCHHHIRCFRPSLGEASQQTNSCNLTWPLGLFRLERRLRPLWQVCLLRALVGLLVTYLAMSFRIPFQCHRSLIRKQAHSTPRGA